MNARAQRRRIAVLLLAPLFLACDRQHETSGSASALPPVTVQAVGPQPGPDVVLERTANPFAGRRDAIAEGRHLFRWYNCEGCHGGRGGGGMGPSLRDATWRYGAGEQEIFNSIAQGRSLGMPAWGTVLPPAQIWQLVSYIRSLDTGAEPSPPPPNPSYPDAPHED